MKVPATNSEKTFTLGICHAHPSGEPKREDDWCGEFVSRFDDYVDQFYDSVYDPLAKPPVQLKA